MDKDMNWRSYVETTHSKYITHYATYAQQNTNNYNELEAELVTMMSAAKQAWEQGAYHAVLDMEKWLWSSGGRFLDLQGHEHEGIELISQAVEATRLLGETFLEERLLGQLGRAWLALESGNLPTTATKYFEQALKIARQINDRQGEASHLGCLGQIHLEEKNNREAIDFFEDALRIAVEIGDRQMQGRLLGSLGFAEMVDYTKEAEEKAISYLNKAIAIARELGDQEGEASHLGCLGFAHETLGYIEPSLRGSYCHKAIQYYERALSIAREIGVSQLQWRLQRDLTRVRSRES